MIDLGERIWCRKPRLYSEGVFTYVERGQTGIETENIIKFSQHLKINVFILYAEYQKRTNKINKIFFRFRFCANAIARFFLFYIIHIYSLYVKTKIGKT